MEDEPENELSETNNHSDKPQTVSENSNETEDKNNLTNGEQVSIETQANTSVDSSTDTIIPNGHAVITKDNDNKNS